MKLLTLVIYVFLTISWLYILIFSLKEIAKSKLSSKSLFTILFLILIIDSIRTVIESTYFGTRLASQYGALPPELFKILSNPNFLFIPKLINAIAALAIIFLIFKKWYPEKVKEEDKLKEKLEQEQKDKKELQRLNKELDNLVLEKTKELQELNKVLEEKVKKEVAKSSAQEQKLFNQTKMAAMGEMLKNIAHQWRQPLSAISMLSSGSIVKSQLDILTKKDLEKDLNQISLTVQHLSDTIEDFQNFFKPTKEDQEFTFEDIIDSTIKIINPIIKSNYVDLEIDMNSKCKIQGPYNEYTQVLLNILNNANDAFKGKDETNRIIKISTYDTQEQSVLKITDNAGGIPEEIMGRIFEPYFTTKHQYHGTGLGLYMSKQIIEKHMNGNIQAQNIEFEHDAKKYKGTQFTITINTPAKENT